MPCRPGQRPTAWWQPTARCSTSMCGRCCGASMPRLTQGLLGSPRNPCRTCPSWRRPRASGVNSKDRRRCPRQRWRSPLPCSRASRLRHSPGLRKRHRIDSLPRARHKPPNHGRSLSRIRSRCRNSSRNGRRSQEERLRRNAGRPPSSHAQCRRRPVRREPRHGLISLNLARHSRREQRRWRKTRHARPFPGRRSSSGAWSPLSSWGSRPVSGCGWPSPVRSVPVQILDSLVPNRRTRVRQPTRTTRGAGRQTACPVPPNQSHLLRFHR